jgi:3-hydroxymyristoyl/3-hydroxydecanoyl-(acyl carrier protein) dehydratase
MTDRIDLLSLEGGSTGCGTIRGKKQVNPADWYFKSHFYQDPVIPGSLGLESFLQVMKSFAMQAWGNDAQPSEIETDFTDAKHGIYCRRGSDQG